MSQNEEMLQACVRENKEFILVCDNEEDANSKRVSLYNLRRKMLPSEQRKIAIKRMVLEGEWVVRVYPSMEKVFEVVDGVLVPFHPLADDSKEWMLEMAKRKMNEEAIVKVLVERGEDEDTIRQEYNKIIGR